MRRIAWLTACLLLFTACDRRSPTPQDAREGDGGQTVPTVLVSILPQAFLVERIAGSRVSVQAVIARGGSEHTYEPSPQQVVGFSRARVYFSIGVAAEEAILRRLREVNPSTRIVDTAAGLPRRRMSADGGLSRMHNDDQDGHDHEHGDPAVHGHDHGGDDPHVWLDPMLASRQADVIAKTLADVFPEHAAEFEAGAVRLIADLARIDSEIETRLSPHRGREVFVYHPSYGYFTDRYGLRQAPVEFEGKEPTPKLLTALVERAKAARTKVIFVQPQFATAPAEALAKAIGGRIEMLDPLSPDYIGNLRDMAGKIDAALRP